MKSHHIACSKFPRIVLHRNTLEITCDKHLTPSGDCIVGIGAQCGCLRLPDLLKTALRRSDSNVRIVIRVGDDTFTVNAHGSPDLILEHASDMVIRKSDFICPRTLAIGSDLASDSLPRSMVSALQDPTCTGTMSIYVD